jgi:hypothetical protein
MCLHVDVSLFLYADASLLLHVEASRNRTVRPTFTVALGNRR